MKKLLRCFTKMKEDFLTAKEEKIYLVSEKIAFIFVNTSLTVSQSLITMHTKNTAVNIRTIYPI